MSLVEEKNPAEFRGKQSTALDDAKARIPQNVAWNWAGYLILLAVTFLIAPLIVHRLGNDAYGVWALIGSLLGYSFLLDFGLRIAVSRYAAQYYALNKTDDLNRVVTSGLAMMLVASGAVTVSGVVAAYFLPRLITLPPGLVGSSRLATILVALGFASALSGNVFNGTLSAASRYDLLNVRNIIGNIFRALLLWYFLEHGYGLVAVALITAIAIALPYSLDYIFVRSQFPALRINRRFLDSRTARMLLHFSGYAFILSVSWRVIFETDNFVVGFFLGPAAVAFYAVGSKLASVLRDTMGTVSNLYFPLASQMDALGERHQLDLLYYSGSRILFTYAMMGVTGLVFVGPLFLGFWMGPEFAKPSGSVLTVLAIEVAVYALSATSGQVLYGVKRHAANAYFSIGNAAANLALSILLVRRLGPVGVAWGTLIPALAFEGFALPAYAARVLKVSVFDFYRSVVLRPVLAAVPLGAWLWFCRSGHIINGYFSLAIVAAVGCLIYGTLAWRFCLRPAERLMVSHGLATARSMLSRLSRRRGEATTEA